MTNVISIDWDFFTLNRQMDGEILNDRGEKTFAPFVYDWQQSETRAPEFEHEIWLMRAASLTMMGFDPANATRPMVSADEFASEISFRFLDGLFGSMNWQADSHAWAAPLMRQLSETLGPLTVWNFDAHHDLGYAGERSKDDDAEAEALDCSNWAWHGLREGWIKNYKIIYPDFRGLKEWRGVERPWLDTFDVRAMTWSQFLKNVKWTDERWFEAGFICRSSSWTPPWQDENFKLLLEEFGHVECLDCLHPEYTRYNSCEPREWDWADVTERIETQRRVRELHEKHKHLILENAKRR